MVWRYVPNCATSRNTLTKNEQTYKTEKLCQTMAFQKKTVDMPVFLRCIWWWFNAEVGAQRHVVLLVFIRKEVPQEQCMLVLPSCRCFHYFILPFIVKTRLYVLIGSSIIYCLLEVKIFCSYFIDMFVITTFIQLIFTLLFIFLCFNPMLLIQLSHLKSSYLIPIHIDPKTVSYGKETNIFCLDIFKTSKEMLILKCYFSVY